MTWAEYMNLLQDMIDAEIEANESATAARKARGAFIKVSYEMHKQTQEVPCATK